MDAPGEPNLQRTWAVVPIRGLRTAKTRLGADLGDAERLALVTEMLRRTLVATRDASVIAGTIVVTLDPAAARLAKGHGAIGLVERVPGLNQAIEAGRSLAAARGATAVLVLPADLPRITPAAVTELVDAAREAADGASELELRGLVTLVPDRHGEGTNALLLSPPAIIAPAFGTASRATHRSEALAAGATYLEIGGPLGLDVDTRADLLLAGASLAAEVTGGR
ncbi:MAG TPA: 2-phospho-L-lactate guanylyltransferase [Candidatus Limnocylindrales bacterium]|nr:2-phospho-L-lactate guanylyltransferase [Candidatus Limnocylindrales bacterium]